ncbi:hypothetical protein GLYMA_18G269100v4 [Glycine max]|uniref:Mitochondrial import inner membrane translocase subunit TIM50 n=1 Tax=Glycine max TaxID=3847 RepID=A0A0R0F554_SOYBN|nr:ubiquitin-like domain-containing CTD phosphatase 1 isoform X2 [Glycine max]KAH1156330.1 hypothetical protein GYH30_051230 [Glycine max]KRH01318.1 hypothetical protein GLYMA_18G269100v4 [Glycine max]|eukprot:XP_006602946.1 ubiquitin-like domain-containing CTD phosphatase 1 isoform X2 [Glycine max]
MEPSREQRKKLVRHRPKEGIKNTMNTESTVLDEANSDKQPRREKRKRKRKKLVCPIPKEGIKNTMNNESTALDETNSDKQPRREKRKKLVCHIPKEGIKDTMNTESTVLDETNSDKQPRREKRKRKKLVRRIPKEGIKNTMNTESSVLDETNSDKQVSRSNELRKLYRQKTLQISTVRPSIVCLKKKLIILDLNGLLVDIVSPPPKYRKPDAMVGKKAMFKRPFYLEFLNFCFEKFEVAVWSSRTKKNINNVINRLMGNMKERLLFCWDLSYCTKTSFKTLENKQKPLVFKDLRKIWEKHDSNLPWEKGYFNQSNTLLLDDSPYKPYNSVFPRTFRFQNESDNSLAVGGDLRQYLDGLANAENMVKYVEQHPFGQEAINERSQSWNFYLKVIDSLSTC